MRRTLLLSFLTATLGAVSWATTVTVTINGTVDTGVVDHYGNTFFNTGVSTQFPANTSFQLVFTFDNTKGTAGPGDLCGDGWKYHTWRSGSGTSNLGTAILTINGKAFHFDLSNNAVLLDSLAMRFAGNPNGHCTSTEPNGALGYFVSATYPTGDGSASVGYTGAYGIELLPASGSFGPIPDWDKSLSKTNTNSAGTNTLPLNIDCTDCVSWDTALHNVGGGVGLIPTDVTIVGVP